MSGVLEDFVFALGVIKVVEVIVGGEWVIVPVSEVGDVKFCFITLC